MAFLLMLLNAFDRRDDVRSEHTSGGREPRMMVFAKAWRWVLTEPFVIAALRRCSKVIPDGPPPTPFSQRLSILLLPDLKPFVLHVGTRSPVRLLVLRRPADLCVPCLAMPVALGDDFPYSPQPFVAAFAARTSSTASASVVTSTEMSPAPAPPPAAPAAPAARPAVPAASPPAVAVPPMRIPAPASAGVAAPSPARPPVPAPASAAAPPHAPAPAHPPVSGVAPVCVPESVVAPPPAPAPARPPPSDVAPVSAPAPAASSASAGATSGPSGLEPVAFPGAAAVSATLAAPSVAVLAYQPPAATTAVQGPETAAAGGGGRGRGGSSSWHPAPDRREGRESTRRRQDSPRRRPSPSSWNGHRGGRAGWRGGRGRRRGWPVEEQQMSPAEIRELVAVAVRDSQVGAVSHHHSQRAAPPAHAPPPAARPAAVPQRASPPRVSPHPPAHYPPPAAVVEPLPFLAGAPLPPQVRVPEATLGQLWRLSESLRALLLVQVTAHASLPPVPADSLLDGPRDDCLDAADQLALLLAPVFAAPARGGVAAVGQLDASVRGLRRYLRAGSGADAIAASTLVVREVWRTLSGLLAALEVDRM
ncbi:unnamed protein product [Closterium sp. Naga37s-1]|nr:unnamed protein product [Closterium sp. Naga37s-1]